VSTPRAIVALHSAELGGPLRSLERELTWLRERAELSLLIPDSVEPPRLLTDLGAPLVRGPYRPLAIPRSPLELAAAADRFRAELEWFRGQLSAARPRLALAVTSTLPAMVAAARRQEVASILSVHELWRGWHRGRLRAQVGLGLLRAQARASAAVIACSEPVAEQLPAGSARVIHPGIPPHAGGDGAGFRRRHRIPPQAPLLACVGSITEGRGQDVLLRSFASLRRSWPQLHCLIVGEPFPRASDRAFSGRLDRLAGELGVSDAVVRLERVEAMPDLYAAADLVVNPATTHPESFGRVALEAGTAGVASVLTTTGATARIHRGGETALLVRPGGEAELSLAAARLLRRPELAQRLARGAAALAARIADPERSLEAFRELIEPALKDPASR
jgi:glycosyltransferase involved in cell wall biosynthesis